MKLDKPRHNEHKISNQRSMTVWVTPVFAAHRSFTSFTRNIKKEMFYAKIRIGSSNCWSSCTSSTESLCYTGKSMFPDIWQYSFPEISAFLFTYDDRIINSLSWKNFRGMSSGSQRMESYCPQTMKFTDWSQTGEIKCSFKNVQLNLISIPTCLANHIKKGN